MARPVTEWVTVTDDVSIIARENRERFGFILRTQRKGRSIHSRRQ